MQYKMYNVYMKEAIWRCNEIKYRRHHNVVNNLI